MVQNTRFIYIGEWCFEVVQLRARKTKKYGNDYSGVASITITDGVAHVEGVLMQDGISPSDKKALKRLLKTLGCDDYESRKPKDVRV